MKITYFLAGIAFMGAIGLAAAQQVGPPPDPQEVQVQLNLTEQALANANHQFIAERTQTLMLRNQIAQAQADAAKAKADSAEKDKTIADLKGQLASAAKFEDAIRPAGPVPPNATPVPQANGSPTDSGPARSQNRNTTLDAARPPVDARPPLTSPRLNELPK